MFITILLLCGLAVDLTIILAFNWLNHWYDFWILIVGLLVGIIIGILFIGMAILIGAAVVKKDKEYEKPHKFHHRMIMRACEFMLQFFRVKVYLRGMDKIPTDKPFLFVLNHQSIFDVIACVWTLRAYPNVFIVKDALSKAPIMGEFINAAGFLGINRTNPREGIKVIKKAADNIANNNLSVVICPEGTRSKTYEMNEFHHGSFKIALKAQCDVVLCGVQNGCKVKERYPFRSTKLYFDVIDVLKYEDIKDMNTQEISDKSQEIINNDLKMLPKYEGKKLVE